MDHGLSSDLIDSDKIWRYMNFYKLMDILETGSLFFSRIDKLGNDFEGLYQDSKLEGHAIDLSFFKDTHNIDIKNLPKEAIRKLVLDENFEKQYRTFAINQRQTSFANSWYRSEHESYSQ